MEAALLTFWHLCCRHIAGEPETDLSLPLYQMCFREESDSLTRRFLKAIISEAMEGLNRIPTAWIPSDQKIALSKHSGLYELTQLGWTSAGSGRGTQTQ